MNNKIKVGDRVKVIKTSGFCSNRIGKTGTVTRLRDVGDLNKCPYVRFDDGSPEDHGFESDLELLSRTPSWDSLQINDTIIHPDGSKAKVLEVGASGKTFFVSNWSNLTNWETSTGIWFHIEEAQRAGYKLESPQEETREFTECDTCRAKPGSPVLCKGCLTNRSLNTY